jgi:hypothetical protein
MVRGQSDRGAMYALILVSIVFKVYAAEVTTAISVLGMATAVAIKFATKNNLTLNASAFKA